MKRTVLIVGLVFLGGCVSIPDVYLIDRHTVMETEAAGDWPELENRFREQSPQTGPTNLSVEPNTARHERAFRVVNGEFPNAPATTVK